MAEAGTALTGTAGRRPARSPTRRSGVPSPFLTGTAKPPSTPFEIFVFFTPSVLKRFSLDCKFVRKNALSAFFSLKTLEIGYEIRRRFKGSGGPCGQTSDGGIRLNRNYHACQEMRHVGQTARGRVSRHNFVPVRALKFFTPPLLTDQGNRNVSMAKLSLAIPEPPPVVRSIRP
jgi:hypothetical protein